MNTMRALAASLLALTLAASANPVVVKNQPWTNAHYSPDLLSEERTKLKIAEEDLTISPSRVRIHYVLANPSAVRREVLYFPLPEIAVGDYWFNRAPNGVPQRAMLGRHTNDPRNFVGFTVKVDGKPVPVMPYQTAKAWQKLAAWAPPERVDVTREILDAGLPLMLIGKSDAIGRLPEAVRRKLFDDHVLGTHDEDRKPGTYPKTYYPAWTVYTGFNWWQDFPAKGRVAVDVAYQPMTGGSLRPVPGSEIWELGKPCYQDWVFPDWTPWGLRYRKAVMYTTTGYILTTANSWNGPIGRFHLTLDKEKPGAVLSACYPPNLQKTGPTTYEFRVENFHPSDDIVMTVLE